jgi:hypothetical protein
MRRSKHRAAFLRTQDLVLLKRKESELVREKEEEERGNHQKEENRLLKKKFRNVVGQAFCEFLSTQIGYNKKKGEGRR